MRPVRTRTTITFEPDVALMLRRQIEETHLPLKTVVNQALRNDLSRSRPARRARFRVRPVSLELRPGIDPDKLNQLVDKLEALEHLRKLNP